MREVNPPPSIFFPPTWLRQERAPPSPLLLHSQVLVGTAAPPEDAVDVLLKGAAIILCLIGVPTRPQSIALCVVNMRWQVCERMFHKLWNALKDL